MSLGTHIEVFSGRQYPKVFPLVRYWSEFSRQEFAENVLQVPLFGIPGIVPFGYLLDFCTDLLLFPVDVVLVASVAEPKIHETFTENDGVSLDLSVRRIQLKYHSTALQAVLPLQVYVTTGSLYVSGVEARNRREGPVRKWKFAPNGLYAVQDNGRETLITPHASKGQTLWLLPPYQRLPSFIPYLHASDNDEMYILWIQYPHPTVKDRMISKTFFLPLNVRTFDFVATPDFSGKVLYHDKIFKGVRLSGIREWRKRNCGVDEE